MKPSWPPDSRANRSANSPSKCGLKTRGQPGKWNLHSKGFKHDQVPRKGKKNMASTFKGFSIKQIPIGENKKADVLSKISSTSFAHLSKQVLVEELREKEIDEKEILAVVEEEGQTWMTPVYEYLTEGILPEDKRKQGLCANYVLREIHEGSCSMHAGPRSMVAKALRSGSYLPTMHTDAKNLIRECKDCQVHRPVPRNTQEKLTPITSSWPFYKWGIDIAGPFPEGPGKSSNGETPFSLTYGAEAVIPAEIGMPNLRTAEVDMVKNIEALGISLDLLEEKREQAAIQEARNKAKMERYYNARVRSTNFRPGDFVYQSNEASHAKDGDKLGSKWEGPYEVTKALGKGAYRLRNHNRHTLPRSTMTNKAVVVS
nr:reverse transcriptase domain-containing protein [Tanacetum cinerariifolium]